MARQTLVERSKSEPVGLATRQMTRFANLKSRDVYQQYGEIGATKGKVYFIPGELADMDGIRPNTAFASTQGTIDYEKPLCAFAAVVDHKTGEVKFTNKFYDSWGQRVDEIRDDIERYGLKTAYARWQSSYANIVNSQTVDNTKALNLLDRVLGLQTRDFFLQLIPTPIPAPNLNFTVDTYTEGSVRAKVPELKSPQLISHSESRTTKTLYKNVGHLAISEEAEFLQGHATMALRQDWTLRDMVRLLNSQIATELETATGVAGSDWGATSGTPPDSTNNPMNDLQGVMTTIKGNGFRPNFLAAHDRPASDLLTNKFIMGRGSIGSSLNDQFLAERFMVPGLPPGVQDQALTNTRATIGDRDGMWLGQGPTIVAQYNEDVAGFRGWLIKQYVLPYLSQTGAVRVLTGISA
jgi:hypothetical protein